MDKGIYSLVELLVGVLAMKTGEYDGAKVCLFKDDIIPNQDTLLADLEAAKATFSGYAEVTVAAFLAPFRDTTGNVYLGAPTCAFTHSGGATDNVIHGWYIKDAAGVVYLGAGRFADAKSVTPSNTTVLVDPFLVIPAQAA